MGVSETLRDEESGTERPRILRCTTPFAGQLREPPLCTDECASRRVASAAASRPPTLNQKIPRESDLVRFLQPICPGCPGCAKKGVPAVHRHDMWPAPVLQLPLAPVRTLTTR